MARHLRVMGVSYDSSELQMTLTLRCACGGELILDAQGDESLVELLDKAEDDYGWVLGPSWDRLASAACHSCASHPEAS